MKTIATFASFAALCISQCAFAELSATVTGASWNESKRQLDVSYNLSGGGAIVTFDVLDGDTPLEGKYLRDAYGDINMRVDAGTHSFTWQPYSSWTGTTENVRIRVKAWAYDNPPPYMAVSCVGSHAVNYYAGEDFLPFAVTNRYYKHDAILFKRIPAKGITWTMGTAGASGHSAQHSVTFTNDYYVGVYPLTLGQYRNMSKWSGLGTVQAAGGANAPDIAIFYTDDLTDYGRARPLVWAAGFRYYIRDLESLDGTAGTWPRDGHKLTNSSRFLITLRNLAPGYEFDYPTEAQWEYACRGGKGTKYCNGSDTNPDSVAWYANNNEDDPDWVAGLPHAVGLKSPNGFGLYDIQGNVHEACLDNWAGNTEQADATDPWGPAYESDDVRKEGSSNHLVSQKVFKGTAFNDASVRGCGEYGIYLPGDQRVFHGVRLFCVAEYKE